MKIWAAILVGCIECGSENLPDELLMGVYRSREQAVDALGPELEKSGYWAKTVGETDRHWVAHYRKDAFGWRGSDSQIRLVEISAP